MAEQYVVSAIKYRPQHFNTVVGQSHITTTLKNAIKTEQLAHDQQAVGCGAVAGGCVAAVNFEH